MRRGDRALSGILALLLATALGYVGVYAVRALSEAVRSATAEQYTRRETLEVTGLVLRREQVLSSQEPCVAVSATAGRRVAAGEELGVAGESEEAVTLALGLAQLEEERRWVEAALLEAAPGLSAERAGQARSALVSLRESLARQDMGALGASAAQLRALWWGGEAERLQARLSALGRRQAALEAELAGLRTQVLTAPSSGLFSPWLDGYEAWGDREQEELTAWELQELLETPPAAPSGYGKLVTSQGWYLAALLPAGSGVAPGQTVEIDLTAYGAGEPPLRCLWVSGEESGPRAAVFSCRRSLEETLALRQLQVPLVLESVTGLRLPAEALRRDEEGGEYVYFADAMTVRRADVTVLWQGEGYAIVESEVLRAGAEVFVGGEGLYDGKLR